MDQQRFDHLSRVFGATPRRSIMRLGLVGIAAAVASRAWPAQARQDDSQTCPVGESFCPAAGCVDLLTDLDHCGACDSPCTSQLVAVDCRNGECVRADCPPELEYCGPVALCRDLQSDPAHCGACDNACTSGVCEGGVCAAGGACAEGQAECDGVCVDTCCNNQHCGACGNACPAGRTCFEGICDCPKGDCGPITPPSTGAGPGPGSTSSAWSALSAAAAAAFAALRFRSVTGRQR